MSLPERARERRVIGPHPQHRQDDPVAHPPGRIAMKLPVLETLLVDDPRHRRTPRLAVDRPTRGVPTVRCWDRLLPPNSLVSSQPDSFQAEAFSVWFNAESGFFHVPKFT